MTRFTMILSSGLASLLLLTADISHAQYGASMGNQTVTCGPNGCFPIPSSGFSSPAPFYQPPQGGMGSFRETFPQQTFSIQQYSAPPRELPEFLFLQCPGETSRIRVWALIRERR